MRFRRKSRILVSAVLEDFGGSIHRRHSDQKCLTIETIEEVIQSFYGRLDRLPLHPIRSVRPGILKYLDCADGV